MGHANIQHPETGMWRCWSTVVDNWINLENYKEIKITYTHRAKHFKAFFEKLLSYCQNTV